MAKWLLLLLFLLIPSAVFADENFDVDYEMFYRVIDTTVTQVTQTTTITNKKTNLYPTEFELSINGVIEGDVTGFDQNGNLEINAQKKDDSSSIIVRLNQKSVGVNNKTDFTLNYKLNNLVSSIGRIYEITIPKSADNTSTGKYNVKLSIPKDFGPLGFIKPAQNFSETESSYLFNFNKNQAKKGIVIGIGDASYFQFKLTYHLSNETILPKTYEIALPPDTRFQDVYYDMLKPKPIDVSKDPDGNWLAQYALSPKQNLEIIASGSALIYAKPKEYFLEDQPQPQHTQPDKFWESDNNTVKAIGNVLKNPESIYNYLTTTLQYNYKRVNSLNKRLGAAQALTNPEDAICMEFTDSFIALARLQNIASREVNGFAYTSDKYVKPLSLVADVLHSWAEYWDENQKAWIPVDPTWGSTTGGVDYFNSLDFNHFVFIRRGISSTYPLPAGSYRSADEAKSVEVLAKADLPSIPQKKIEFLLNQSSSFISSSSKIIVTVNNQSGKALYRVPVEVKADGLSIGTGPSEIDLLPFSKKDIIVSLKQKTGKFWGTVPVHIRVDGVEKVIQLKVDPKEVFYLIIIFGVSLLLYVQKRRAQTNIR